MQDLISQSISNIYKKAKERITDNAAWAGNQVQQNVVAPLNKTASTVQNRVNANLSLLKSVPQAAADYVTKPQTFNRTLSQNIKAPGAGLALQIPVQTGQAYIDLAKKGVPSALKLASYALPSLQSARQLAKIAPTRAMKFITEPVTSTDVLNTAGLIGSANPAMLASNTIGGAVNAGIKIADNALSRKPLGADLGSAYREGVRLSAQIGPTEAFTKWAAMPALKKLSQLSPLIAKVSKNLTPQEVTGFKTWITESLKKGNVSGVNLAVYGALQDAQNGNQRLKNIWDQYKTGALFGTGLNLATNIQAGVLRPIQSRFTKMTPQEKAFVQGGFAKLDEPIIKTGKKADLSGSTIDLKDSSTPPTPAGRIQQPITMQEKRVFKQPREEKIALSLLKKGDITIEQYNAIARKNEFRELPISSTSTRQEIQSQAELKAPNTSFQQPLSDQVTQSQEVQVQPLLNKEGPQGMGIPPKLPPKKSVNGVSDQKSSDGSIANLLQSTRNKLNSLYTKSIDRFHPISMLAKEAGQEQATRNAFTGYYGAGSKAEYHVDYELTPILREQNIDDLRTAAIAFRDIELSKRGIQGSNTTDPQTALRDLENRLGKDKVAALGKTLKKLYAYQDKMVRNYLVDTGIINRDSYENMRKNNQFYVPFKRVMDKVDEFLGVVPQTKNAGSVSSQDVIKGIKGSSREIVDPIESIIEASYKMVNIGQRQKVAQQIVKLGMTKPGLVTPLMGEAGNKPHIALFHNGKVIKYSVPEDVAIAAKGLTDDGINTLVKILQVPTKIFRASATGLNPEFAIPNVFRDLQSAWVNYGLNPLTWVRGFARFVKKDELYQEFLKSGGKTSFVAIDKPTIRKNVQDISGKGLSVLHPKRLLDFAGYISEASEMGTRVSLFEQELKNNLKRGLPREEAAVQAAYAAQEGTVNFARRGADTKSVNAIYAFLNARAQGIDRLIRSFKNNPKSSSVRLALLLGAPTLALYAHNRNFASYDDERVLSPSDKSNNFIIMLADKPIPQLGGAQYLKIPKAEVGKFANPLESFLAMLDGKDGKSKEALLTAIKGFSPIDNMGDLIPTALRPPVEVAANRSFFFNTDIVPDYKTNYPAPYQYSSYTAPVYKMIGEKLNISPAKIQALVEGYATGWAKIAETSTRPLIPASYKTTKDTQGQNINRTPIARRVLGGERRSASEQNAINDKRTKSIEFQINDIKSGVNRGDLPFDVGVREIQKLRTKQSEITNTNKTQQSSYYLTDDEGKLKEIDVSKPITLPALSGIAELDKQAISRYKAAITKRTKDIQALYSAGQIDVETALQKVSMLKTLALKLPAYTKPKAVKIRTVSYKKLKTLKIARPKKIKVKRSKLKLTGIKAKKWKAIRLRQA